MKYTVEDYEEFLKRMSITSKDVQHYTGYSRQGLSKFTSGAREFNPRIIRALEMIRRIKELEEINRIQQKELNNYKKKE